ncbi:MULTISPECIES: HAMP domain-containing sensor histidine kinase [unclassified Streptomyces]|uniref:HAMP domain-containing sensor histidine kinase n=1 Tax=unclassified Streptomyces TaxID=2593676 RepID=UPI00081F6AF1|nr:MULTISPECIES: HAMP domain-containing sensor histidine kinase [unclassified Streptomyces]SCD83989.1 two-component system, NarL family, sensor histidine kinase UhpB [Streptomyces sp. TverLS-915]SCF45557.1 two-component system, NarL family, sensor histidine kinase UhpB [Streptomyces sp. LcepLS]
MSLFQRIFLLNAAVLLAATGLLLLGPVTVSAPVVLTEVLILSAGLVAMLTANAALLRIGLAPLQRLHRAMSTTDLLRPGRRPDVSGHGEIAGLITAFNTMLDRLEAERATSTARALSAQEAERRRIAQELHDEVGQTLTAVLLELKSAAKDAPPALAERLHQVQETTRGGLDEIRRIARRLRPGVLDELGLRAALASLVTELPADSGLRVRRAGDRELPELDKEVELVLYRVAQEALTNVVRHARARDVRLTLRALPRGVELTVADDGRGLGDAAEGAGLRGMRERALLIGAHLSIGPGPAGGTEIRLAVPLRTRPSPLPPGPREEASVT